LIDEEVYITLMKAVIANLIIAFGFLRKEVPTGCCHACEFCCMQECATKYAGTVTTEEEDSSYGAGGPETLPEALAKVPPKFFLQVSKMDKVAVSKSFERCLAQKAGCPKDPKKWDPKRKSVTVSCLKDVVAGKSFAQVGKEDPMEDPDEHLQACPDHGVEYCQARKPAEVFETGMTLEECTEMCIMTECGCPFS